MPRAPRSRKPTTGADVPVAAAPASATAPVAPRYQEIAILTRKYGRLHRAVRNLETGLLLSPEQDNLDTATFDIVAEGQDAVTAAPVTVPSRKVCRRCFPS